MQFQKFLNKQKKRMLPQIKDWSLDYQDKRKRKDWWNMPHIEFFVFHPVAYKWTLFGINASSLLVFGFFCIRWIIFGLWPLAILSGLIAAKMGQATYLKLKTWKVKSDINFYDLLFREYNLAEK